MTFHDHHEWNIRTNKSNGTLINPNQREIERLAASFFVTNFPNNLNERDLWKLFDEYAKVADIYIARKLSKSGRKFAFVRFLNIKDEKRLEVSLGGVWVGNYHLFVSFARFKRDHKNIPKPTGDNQVHEPGKKRNNHGIGAE
ncbi:unnamed protein product [Lactuca virosa]|uniref:RRM domain-containing protein n=1 Tax=Lactuca virosa TaxID=75947 RepID=A0AAU9MV00_9ASTR|nr:unnamed protein product [Lactuca virosa]